jgi:hypothetical protein
MAQVVEKLPRDPDFKPRYFQKYKEIFKSKQ